MNVGILVLVTELVEELFYNVDDSASASTTVLSLAVQLSKMAYPGLFLETLDSSITTCNGVLL